jgi:hypothetical protein
MAVAGDGFYVVEQGGVQSLTRAGNFQLDSSGNLITQDGQQVIGYPSVNSASGVVNQDTSLTPITIPFGAGSRAPFYLSILFDSQSGFKGGFRRDVLVSNADIRHAWPKSPINSELYQNCGEYIELFSYSARRGGDRNSDKYYRNNGS